MCASTEERLQCRTGNNKDLDLKTFNSISITCEVILFGGASDYVLHIT